MQNFKQYLSEAKVDFAPWQDPNNPAYIPPSEDLIKRNSVSLRKNKDNTYSCNEFVLNTSTLININGKKVLPVKFKTVKDFISGDHIDIDSFWGVPDKIKIGLLGSYTLTTLDHLNCTADVLALKCKKLKTCGDAKVIVNDMRFSDIGSVSFKELAEHFTINQRILCPHFVLYKKPLLSILNFKGTWNNINIGGTSSITKNLQHDQNLEVESVLRILNNHLVDRDIFACKEELISNGYKEYAKL